MAKEKYRLPGGWPLGAFTITPATPKQLVANPGTGTNRPACRQIVVDNPAASSGAVYVMLGNHPYTDTDHILATVYKGTVQSLPYSSLLSDSEFDLSNIYVDGPNADTCQITAFV